MEEKLSKFNKVIFFWIFLFSQQKLFLALPKILNSICNIAASNAMQWQTMASTLAAATAAKSFREDAVMTYNCYIPRLKKKNK